MARTIFCDAPGCQAEAAWMLTAIQNGVVQGLCGPHFLVTCAGMVARAAGDELDPEVAQALAREAGMADPATAGTEPSEVYTCQGCGAEFASIETIEQHVADVHTAPPVEGRCPCGHPENGYECPECGHNPHVDDDCGCCHHVFGEVYHDPIESGAERERIEEAAATE